MKTIRSTKAAAVAVFAVGALLFALEAAAGAADTGSQGSGRQSVAGADPAESGYDWQPTPIDASVNDFGWQ
ncbi:MULTISPECIES: hypothetical protein [Streptomyces]|uniref:hypothetical protein n=1 Tax=Streptomyces TaxID=1883 RepID=UPI00109E5170|nr:hypothetical protein [Streptomyces sp. LRa12]THA88201.1 hypothetical protein E6R61_26810 [Streptomyces sp. LRa12]WTC50381.1 hypothetical protein OG855_22660 [Streptomyces anthocyanicus]